MYFGKIINLTQHTPTEEQVKAGVFDWERDKIVRLLTFESIPYFKGIESRAKKLAKIAVESGAEYAMIGGASYLIAALEKELFNVKVSPLHAFSKREVFYQAVEYGVVKKVSIFKHVGFVLAKPR